MIYNLVIYIYLFGVKVAGLFSAKPAKMVKGHREVFDILRNKIDKNARYICCLLYTSPSPRDSA